MLVEIRPSPPTDWPDLVGADPAADYFHTIPWTRITAAHLPAGRPLWLAVRDGGRLIGGLSGVRHGGRVRRVHSGAWGCSGGPLVAAGLPEDEAGRIRDALVDALLNQCGSRLSVCGISLNPGHEERWGARLAADPRFTRHDVPAAVVPLEGGPEAVASRMRKSKRNERNRGLRHGAEVAVSRDPADLAAYHRLHVAAARLWGQRPLSLALMQELLDLGGGDEGGSAFFVCVRYEGRVVGGHLNFHLGDRVTAWHGVTDPSLARTHFPATVAVWGDVVEGCRRGARWLDLGGSNGIASLTSFKRGFGAEEQARGWYTNETRLLALLGGLRGLWQRRGDRRRWHDGATGAPRGGGS